MSHNYCEPHNLLTSIINNALLTLFAVCFCANHKFMRYSCSSFDQISQCASWLIQTAHRNDNCYLSIIMILTSHFFYLPCFDGIVESNNLCLQTSFCFLTCHWNLLCQTKSRLYRVICHFNGSLNNHHPDNYPWDNYHLG